MKKTVMLSFAIFSLLFASCEKQPLTPQQPGKGNIIPVVNVEEKKFDYFACTGEDGNGHQCAGQRCGVPNGGTCKKVESTCHCLSAQPSAGQKELGSLTVEEYKAMWKDENGRKKLLALGIKQADFE